MDSLVCEVWGVHFEISSFEFEVQDSSNFKFPSHCTGRANHVVVQSQEVEPLLAGRSEPLKRLRNRSAPSSISE